MIFEDKFYVPGKKIIKKYIKELFVIIQKQTELTENLAFHKFIKNIIIIYFNDLDEEMNVLFTFFWNHLSQELKHNIINNKQSKNIKARTKTFKFNETLQILKKILRGSKNLYVVRLILYHLTSIFL